MQSNVNEEVFYQINNIKEFQKIILVSFHLWIYQV